MEATFDKNGDSDREKLPRRGRERQSKDRGDIAQAREIERPLQFFSAGRNPSSGVGRVLFNPHLSCSGGLKEPAHTQVSPESMSLARPLILASFISSLVTGLATGAIYAPWPSGLRLLWQTSQTIQFRPGEFVMLPASFIHRRHELPARRLAAASSASRSPSLFSGLCSRSSSSIPCSVTACCRSSFRQCVSLFSQGERQRFLQLERRPFRALWPQRIWNFGAVIQRKASCSCGCHRIDRHVA